MSNMKKKIILTGKDGRPSTKYAWSFSLVNPTNPTTLVQRRRFVKKNGKIVQYYRVFGDPELYQEDQLYQLKFKNFDFTNSIIIRWGTREEIDTTNSIVYNTSKAIHNATNKALSRKLFIKNSVPTPRLITSIDEYDKLDKNSIIIARPHIHSKGKNLIVLTNKTEFINHFNKNSENWYYSEFIDKIAEFRVHVGSGKALCLMEKHKPNNNNIAWNRAINHSEPFTRVYQKDSDSRNLRAVIIAALNAVKALDLDMGAADIIVDKNGNPYVLEINTAPTLNSSPYTAEMWCKYWNWLLRSNTKRKHWDYNKFNKASSLFWKQNQLLT